MKIFGIDFETKEERRLKDELLILSQENRELSQENRELKAYKEHYKEAENVFCRNCQESLLVRSSDFASFECALECKCENFKRKESQKLNFPTGFIGGYYPSPPYPG